MNRARGGRDGVGRGDVSELRGGVAAARVANLYARVRLIVDDAFRDPLVVSEDRRCGPVVCERHRAAGRHQCDEDVVGRRDGKAQDDPVMLRRPDGLTRRHVTALKPPAPAPDSVFGL